MPNSLAATGLPSSPNCRRCYGVWKIALLRCQCGARQTDDVRNFITVSRQKRARPHRQAAKISLNSPLQGKSDVKFGPKKD